MPKPPEPGVAGRDYVPAGGTAADDRWGAATDPNAPIGPLNPNAANGAKAWLDAITPPARNDHGAQHSRLLNDPERVELYRVQRVAELVGKAVLDAGLDCGPDAIKRAVLDLVAADCERRGQRKPAGVRACDIRLPGEPPLRGTSK